MSGLVGVIWIIIIIYRIANRDKESKSAKTTTQWPLVIGFLVWFGAASTLIYIYPIDRTSDVGVIAAIVILCVPWLWLWIPIQAGWVKGTYYLSFMRLRSYGESLRAGAAFNALCALDQKSSVTSDARREHVEWIRRKACETSKRATSGALMMWVLLEFDKDSDRFAKPLSDMHHVKKGTVPTEMATYAFARLMAYWLPKKDWDQIARISNQWRKKWRLPLATLIELHYHKVTGTAKVGTLAYWYFWMRCGSPYWLHRLPIGDAGDSSDDDGADMDWDAVKASVVVAALDGQRCLFEESGAALLPENWRHKWRRRAELLHCRDADASLENIVMSLGAMSQLSEDSQGGERDEEAADYALTRIRYLANAIRVRQESGKLQSGMVEFQEWLNLSEVFEALIDDSNMDFQAFSILEYTVWNWMADLWNIKAEKSLSYMLCSYMHPYASKFGSESRSAYRAVLVGEVA